MSVSGSSFNKRSLFIMAVAAGCLSVIFSIVLPFNPNFFGVVVPVGILAMYIYFGHSSEASNAENTQYADSIYYLGFIFTLFALCATLADFEDVNDSVIARFGLALVTTLIGLIARVSITNFSTSYTEALSIAENSLYLSVMRFDAHLRANLHQLIEFEEQLALATKKSIDTHDENVEHINQVSTAAIEAVNAEISEAVNKLKRDIEELELPSDIFASKLTPPVEELISELTRLGRSISTYNSSQEEAFSKVADTTNDFVENLESAANQIDSSLSKFDSIALSSNTLNIELDGLSDQMRLGAQAVNQQIEAVESLSKTVGELDEVSKLEVAEIRLLLRATNTLQKAVTRIQTLTGRQQV
jgi:hypothetical protein